VDLLKESRYPLKQAGINEELREIGVFEIQK
jgi:hypothetical protein